MKRNPGKSVSAIAALCLMAVFALCVLTVLLSGAGAYSRIVRRDGEISDSRSCAHYLSSKLRQAESPESVYLESFGGETALVLESEPGGVSCLTRLYWHEGWIMELFTAGDTEFSPGDGERILPAAGLEIEMDGGIVRFRLLSESGVERELVCFVRGQEGAGP